MRFDFEQLIAAPLDRVEEALGDPRFYQALDQTPGLRVLEVVDQARHGDVETLRVRFAFTGEVAPAVRTFVDPSQLTWVTVLTRRAGTHVLTFEIVPDHHRELLHCRGGYRLAAAGADTHQEVAGDLSVRVPLVGRGAERVIVAGFQEHLAAEAEILATWTP